MCPAGKARVCVFDQPASKRASSDRDRSKHQFRACQCKRREREAAYFQPLVLVLATFSTCRYLAPGRIVVILNLGEKQLTLWQGGRGCGRRCHEKACVTLCTSRGGGEGGQGKWDGCWPVAEVASILCSRGGQQRSQEVTWTD